MTLVCPKCSARYNIQDSLIPAQGARVKCKKCETVMTIPPPVVELAPQDLELIPPPAPALPPEMAPALPPTPKAPSPRSAPPAAPAPPPAPEFERGFVAERAPVESVDSEIVVDRPFEGTANLPPADPGFERGGAPPRFGSPPSFTESAPPAPRVPEPPARRPEPEPKSNESLEGLDTSLAMSAPAVAAEERPASIPVPEAAPRAGASFGTPASDSTSTSPTPGGTPIPAGLAADEQSKHEKARRLARVLASDIAIYNREKRDRGIREGNLVAMLGYEIKKSWEIYKERVGAEFANSTPYFRDALNEMLAEGKKIF